MTKKIILDRDQIIDLLTCAAAYDRRTIGETDIAAWTLAVGDLPIDDAKAAVVAHYTDTTDWLMPAHVRRQVKHIRELRLAARPIPAPELTNDALAYREELQASIRRLADSKDPVRALPLPGHGAHPTPEYDRARGAYRDPLRLAALKVRCPWSNCAAAIGSGCRTQGGTLIEGHGHDARLVAAGLADWVEVDGHQRAVLHGQDTAS